MSMLLDIVPNHMCISSDENIWWREVLESGSKSIYADFFDIRWQNEHQFLTDKVFLPILDRPVGRAIEDGLLKVILENGNFSLHINDQYLPLNLSSLSIIFKHLNRLPQNSSSKELKSILLAIQNSTCFLGDKQAYRDELLVIKQRLKNLILGSTSIRESLLATLEHINRDHDILEEIINVQYYRLSFWRLSSDLINYRRFFDINELACLRIEKEAVFQQTHALITKLVDHNILQGLRVDHIDGLYAPGQYLQKLRKINANFTKIYLVVEKILVGSEQLNPIWPVAGTTGYDYLNVINSLFIYPDSAHKLAEIYYNFIGSEISLSKLEFDCKKMILSSSMSSELTVLTHRLHDICQKSRHTRDFSFKSLKNALKDIISAFSVYRTYLEPGDEIISETDSKVISHAVSAAKAKNPLENHLVFEFIESVLQQKVAIPDCLEFTHYFQQVTGPVMAKGLEDTALYRSYILASRNEVGMDPTVFGVSVKDFHQITSARAKNCRFSLTASTTHDTKRSEDVRARINVLSEIPDQWQQALLQWHATNFDKKKLVNNTYAPSRNEEFLLYQTLIGSWPASIDSKSEMQTYIKRIQAYMVKALKEAKVNTSWVNPVEPYETAVCDFISEILDPKNSSFVGLLSDFVDQIKYAAFWSSIMQTALKILLPGVPDFYQGTELLELMLVDPDNRRPVDFAKRAKILQRQQKSGKKQLFNIIDRSLKDLQVGELKLYLINKLLKFRQTDRDLFDLGKYSPVKLKNSVNDFIAFKWQYKSKQCLVIVPMFFMQKTDSNGHIDHRKMPTEILFNSSAFKGKWRNVLDENKVVDLHSISKHIADLPLLVLTNHK